jgi:hypothetical protein
MIRSIVSALVAVSAVVGSASMTQAQTAPTSPAATAAAVAGGVPLHTLAAQGNPNVKVERIDLSPSECARVLAGVSASQLSKARSQQCSMLHYSFHANHLPVPSGDSMATGAPNSGTVMNSGICCGFWYYTNGDELTDPTGGSVWSANEWEDGDANGRNVYAWHNQCTPAGLGVAMNDCFTNFNGGGAPYYGLQYGMDICTGLTTSWVSACFHHGQRRWIDDWGNPSTYYHW